MSRSTRKPYEPVVRRSGAKCMARWKKWANRLVRRNDEDLPDGTYYKMILDNWGSPRDGINVFRKNPDPKLLRK